MTVEHTIRSWCYHELQHWNRTAIGSEAFAEAAESLNSSHLWAFLFDVVEGTVRVRSKPSFFSLDQMQDKTLGPIERMLLYKNFLQEAIVHYPALHHTLLVVDVSDGDVPDQCFPVFCFQKNFGSNKVLLPDPDFVHFLFYETKDIVDPVPFEKKRDVAMFVGSTTGAPGRGNIVTKDAVDTLSVPRLRAGVRFQNHPLVDFRLPAIVQCDSPETVDAVRALGFGVGACAWHEQYQAKSLISIDGNGATCSRVVLSLRSNSILMKYDSPSQLYYFSGLKPWLHYIPIRDDEDVIHFAELIQRDPTVFRYTVEEGQAFCRDYLTRDCVYRYVGMLIGMYAEMLRG